MTALLPWVWKGHWYALLSPISKGHQYDYPIVISTDFNTSTEDITVIMMTIHSENVISYPVHILWCTRIGPGAHFTNGLLNHHWNIEKILFALILISIIQSWHNSAHGMCKIETWSDSFFFDNELINPLWNGSQNWSDASSSGTVLVQIRHISACLHDTLIHSFRC